MPESKLPPLPEKIVENLLVEERLELLNNLLAEMCMTNNGARQLSEGVSPVYVLRNLLSPSSWALASWPNTAGVQKHFLQALQTLHANLQYANERGLDGAGEVQVLKQKLAAIEECVEKVASL